MKQPAEPTHPLSAQRAFLVQVYAEASVARGALAGRVEHVVSGQARRFVSPADLVAFMAAPSLSDSLPHPAGRDSGAQRAWP